MSSSSRLSSLYAWPLEGCCHWVAPRTTLLSSPEGRPQWQHRFHCRLVGCWLGAGWVWSMEVLAGDRGKRGERSGRFSLPSMPPWHCFAKNQALQLCFPWTASPLRDSPWLRTTSLLLISHWSPHPSPQLCDEVLLKFPTRSPLVKDADRHSQLLGGRSHFGGVKTLLSAPASGSTHLSAPRRPLSSDSEALSPG